MSTFVLRKEYALQMPNNYVEIDKEEMEYVDGGVKEWWNSVGFISGVADVAIAVIPALFAISKFMKAGSIAKAAAVSAGNMSRKALREAFVQMSVKLAGATGWAALSALGGALFDISMTLFGTSLGGIVANSIDIIDGTKNGFCFG